jgi:Flp pilus assembly protein TadD
MMRRPFGLTWPALLLALLAMSVSAEDAPVTSPESALSQTERGMLLEVNDLVQEARFTEADAMLRSILDRNPDFNQARQIHAAVLISLNQYEQAIAELEELLRRQPDDPRAMNNLAWMLATSTDTRFREPARALQLAQDAVLLSPSDYHMWSTLAEAHRVNANFEQALKAIRQAIELAARRNAPPDTRATYQRQFEELREVASIMSLIE